MTALRAAVPLRSSPMDFLPIPTQNRPLVPLRWYEELLLWFLIRSPRIQSIYVIQEAPGGSAAEEAPPAPRPPVPPDGRPTNLPAYVRYLEHVLRNSPEDDPRKREG